MINDVNDVKGLIFYKKYEAFVIVINLLFIFLII